MKRSGKWVAIGLLLVVNAFAFAQERMPKLPNHEPKLIDVHVHYSGQPGYLQKLLIKLRRTDGMAILLTTPNAYAKAQAAIRQHPNRFMGFCNLDQYWDTPDILERVDHCHAMGFLGIGEIESTQHDYDSRTYLPIYERAQRYHMIVLFHTGIEGRFTPQQPSDVSFDRERVTRLDLIARLFPKLIIIGAHLGNPDYAEAAEIGRWDPNLYFDVSGSTLIKTENNYAFFKSIFWWSGVVSQNTPNSSVNAFEKLVFGSDDFGAAPTEFDLALSRYHKMLDACDVPARAQAMIFSGTIWKILKRQRAAMADSDQASHGHSQNGAL